MKMSDRQPVYAPAANPHRDHIGYRILNVLLFAALAIVFGGMLAEAITGGVK